MSKDFVTFCEEDEIRRQLTAPYTPEQNGVVKHKSRTVVEMARSMMKTKDLSDEFWAEAVATGVYILNISPAKVKRWACKANGSGTVLDNINNGGNIKHIENDLPTSPQTLRTAPSPTSPQTLKLQHALKLSLQQPYLLLHLLSLLLGIKNSEETLMNTQKVNGVDGLDMTYARKYRSLVGKLIYLTHTRPDLAFLMRVVSRCMHYTTKHFGVAKRILRYIVGTKDFGVWYFKTESFMLKGFTDNDSAGSQDDRKSRFGNCVSLSSGPISWPSKKEAIVALSSAEDEYIAVSISACQAVWLQRMLCDLKQEQEGATLIYCDSSSAIAMTRNPIMHGRTRHIEIKYHYIRELVIGGKMRLDLCRSMD
ncbi:retrovirus-related pol polyprotein from transposon TNT 1-94 [Tanacetum coccineum]